MSGNHIVAGLILFALTLGVLAVKYFRCKKQTALPSRGWVGIAIIAFAELFLILKLNWVTIYFTPLVWTGYVLLADGLVWTLRGQSRLGAAPREFFRLAFWSVPLWLIFEAYNFRLENWTYVGLPESPVLRGIGYVWSFATIWPAIHETADLLQALGLGSQATHHRFVCGPRAHVNLALVGLALVTIPVLLPPRLGSYLFGAIWVGFVLLLDPLNFRWRGRSLLRDLEQGQTSTLYPFLVSGLVCGIFWEFWNFWAAAKWVYIFPIWQNAKIFEMPLPGFLGFPPFALECFVMHEFLLTARRRLAGFRLSPPWQAAGSRL